jgi:hypothetical protein
MRLSAVRSEVSRRRQAVFGGDRKAGDIEGVARVKVSCHKKRSLVFGG